MWQSVILFKVSYEPINISENFLAKFIWRTSTLRKEIFAGINFREFFFGHFLGINFREFGFIEDFAGINFHELSLTKDSAGINFRESTLYKDFAGVNLTFTLRNIFSSTLIYGFENNLSKN